MRSPLRDRRTPAGRRTAVRSRRRFARRQWARRWLAWGTSSAVLLVLALRRPARLGGLLLLGARRPGRRGRRATSTLGAAAGPRRGRRARRASRWPGVDLDRIRARVEALGRVRSADVTRQWPDQVLIRSQEREAVAVVEIGGRLRGHGRRRRGVPRLPPGAAADLPRVQTATDTRSEALARGAPGWSRRCPPTSPAARRPRRGRDRRPDLPGAARRPHRRVGERGRSPTQKAEVLAALLRASRRRTYDVSVPGQPTTPLTRPASPHETRADRRAPAACLRDSLGVRCLLSSPRRG